MPLPVTFPYIFSSCLSSIVVVSAISILILLIPQGSAFILPMKHWPSYFAHKTHSHVGVSMCLFPISHKVTYAIFLSEFSSTSLHKSFHSTLIRKTSVIETKSLRVLTIPVIPDISFRPQKVVRHIFWLMKKSPINYLFLNTIWNLIWYLQQV